MATAITTAGPSTSALKTLSTSSDLERLRGSLTGRTVQTESGEMKFRPDQMPTEEERRKSIEAIGKMRKSLGQKFSSDVARKAILRLVAGLKPSEGSNPATMIEVMTVAVADVPPDVLEMAVFELVTGTTDSTGPKYSRTFTPSSAELATLCRTIRERLTLRASHMEFLLSRPEARRVVELPEAERRARAAQIAGLVRTAASEEAKS